MSSAAKEKKHGGQREGLQLLLYTDCKLFATSIPVYVIEKEWLSIIYKASHPSTTVFMEKHLVFIKITTANSRENVVSAFTLEQLVL